MAHRWVLPKVASWEVHSGAWDLGEKDLMLDFFGSLPRPKQYRVEATVNGKGQPAEIYHLVYDDGQVNKAKLFHGTTFKAVRSILQNGFKESNVKGVHEFTVPGVYVADKLEGSLFYHAVATKFKHPPVSERLPYIRFVFVVEPMGKARKVSSYGPPCMQHVYASKDLRVLELRVFRGWNFCDSGEKVISNLPSDFDHLNDTMDDSTVSPSVDVVKDTEVPLQVTCVPPPTPIAWQEHFHLDTQTGQKLRYFENLLTKETTWTVPQDPYYPSVHVELTKDTTSTVPQDAYHSTAHVPGANSEQEEDSSADLMFQTNPRGQVVCCLCNKEDSKSHRSSKQHLKRLPWWDRASLAERRKWAEWVTLQWR